MYMLREIDDLRAALAKAEAERNEALAKLAYVSGEAAVCKAQVTHDQAELETVWGMKTALDKQVDELRTQLAESNAEIAEQCRLHGMGSEREAKLLAQLEQAQRRLEALAAQEPVAVVRAYKTPGPRSISYSDRDIAGLKNGTLLYAAAGAAPVPDMQSELVDALEELMRWQAKNVKCWHNSAYDNAARVLKKRAAAGDPT